MIVGAASVAVAAGAIAVLRPRRLEVSGTSMYPTLEPGDRLVAVGRAPLRPGDLAVVPDPRDRGRLVVKRVAATTGDSLTVLGDNPAASTDSRHFGAVARASVRGRVVYRYHPASRRGWIGPLVP